MACFISSNFGIDLPTLETDFNSFIGAVSFHVTRHQQKKLFYRGQTKYHMTFKTLMYGDQAFHCAGIEDLLVQTAALCEKADKKMKKQDVKLDGGRGQTGVRFKRAQTVIIKKEIGKLNGAEARNGERRILRK